MSSDECEPKFKPGDTIQVMSVVGQMPVGEVQMAYWHQDSRVIGKRGHQRYVVVIDGVQHDVCELEIREAA